MESLKKSRNTMFLRRVIQEGGTEQLWVGGRRLREGETWALSDLNDSPQASTPKSQKAVSGV